MSEWRTVKLGEVAIVKGGKRLPKGKDLTIVDTGHPYIRARDIRDGKVTFDDPVFVPEDVLPIIRNYKVNEGDICITIVGANVGDVGQVPAFLDGANLTENAVKVIAINEKCCQQYLKYVLLTEHPQAEMKTVAGGAAQPKLGIYKIIELEIPLPPLETQRRIAAILSAYDDLIENNTRRIQALEQAAHDLYREWFVEFRFPGHESVELVDSGTEYGMIPQVWEVRLVDKSFDILGGGTPSTKNPEYWDDGDIVWFSPSDLTAAKAMFISDSSKHITSIGLQKSSSKMFPAYSVMMTSRATLGVTAINTMPACTNQGFITCIPNERVSAYQIYFWIAENLEKIISVASGATFKEINKTTFRQFPFLIADKNITEQFNQIVEPIGNQIENLLHRNNALREARDLLLPRLVSGQLDVGAIEIDAIMDA